MDTGLCNFVCCQMCMEKDLDWFNTCKSNGTCDMCVAIEEELDNWEDEQDYDYSSNFSYPTDYFDMDF